ncbi:MAG TPA: hypothetical protein VFA44_03300 [Gaiellaceae bacterium]|nr:hypothetical protein [Gaiellaceae bacterium]
MPEYLRVATFDADEHALEALVREIESTDGPPEGVPAKSMVVLADRPGRRVRIAVRFASEEDLRAGSETLDAMEPPPDAAMRRTDVEVFEVVLERHAS